MTGNTSRLNVIQKYISKAYLDASFIYSKVQTTCPFILIAIRVLFLFSFYMSIGHTNAFPCEAPEKSLRKTF